jgi:hypothetical protein
MKTRLLLGCVLFFSLLASAAAKEDREGPLQGLVRRIRERVKDPSLIDLDYTLHEFTRPPERQKALNIYKGRIQYSRSLIPRILFRIFDDRIRESLESLERIRPLGPERCLAAFEKLLSKGETLKTGDLVLISAMTAYSLSGRKYADIEYSHTGMVWARKDGLYVLQVHPQADFLMLPMIDFILPAHPKNFALGIYRHKDGIDEIEMDYLFREILKHKDRIIFDDYCVNTPPIRDPEIYFQRNNFFYCTEFLYLCYRYILNRNDFLSSKRPSMKSLVHQFVPPNPVVDFTVNLIDNMDREKDNFIIVSNHFSESDQFRELLRLEKEYKTP